MDQIDTNTIQRGPKGDKGGKGEIGLQGWGLRGHTGPTGPIGIKGDKSTVMGPTGVTGPIGNIGLIGNTGVTGPVGERGDRGFYGMKGVKGDVGDKGTRGIVSDLQTAVFSFGTFSIGDAINRDIGLLPPGFFMGGYNNIFDGRLSSGGGLIKIDNDDPILCYHSCPFNKFLLKRLSYTVIDNFKTGMGSSHNGDDTKASTVTLPIQIAICKFVSTKNKYIGNNHCINYFGTVDNKEFTNIKLPNLPSNDNKVNSFKDKDIYMLEINTAINPIGSIELNDIEVGMGEGIGIYINVNDTINGICTRDDILTYLPYPPYQPQPTQGNNWTVGDITYSAIRPLSISIMGVSIS